MTLLDRMGAAYWEAFRQGYFQVGGRPEDYPRWEDAPKAVKDETLRCLRHAGETLRDVLDADTFNAVFPEPLTKRGEPMTINDQAFVQQTKLARTQEQER